jgi:hypothetical protein
VGVLAVAYGLARLPVGGVPTGDITVENFEFAVTAASWNGSWGGSPSAPDLSVKTTKVTC